jgi:hypothetical protein
MGAFINKLKEDYIALLVAALLGIPAWGILVPQLFSILSTSETFDLSCLFRVFVICYFTLPFFVLFILVIFQLKDELVMAMRARMLRFIGGILVVMVLVLCFHSNVPEPNDGHLLMILLYVAFGLTIGLLIYYIFSLIKRIDELAPSEVPLPAETAVELPVLADSEPLTGPPVIKLDKAKQGPVLITFSILFLFIPIQWMLSLLAVISRHFYNSYWFLGISVIAYLMPAAIYYYRKGRMTENDKANPKISKVFLFRSLIVFPVFLLIVLFFADRHVMRYNFRQEEIEYDNLFNTTVQLANITIPEMELLQYVRLADTLETDLHRRDSILGTNSLAAMYVTPIFNKRTSEVSLPMQGEYRSLDLYDFCSKLDREVIFDTTQFKMFCKERNDTGSSGARFYYKKMLKDSLLDFYGTDLILLARIQSIHATDDLLSVARETQRTGVFVFGATLLILAFILLMLFFKDDKYAFWEVREIITIRKILGIVALLIAILLLPLVKTLSKEDIRPDQPWNIFKLGNWNLYNGFSTGEKPAKTPLDTLKKTGAPSCCCTPAAIVEVKDSTKDLSELVSQINELVNLEQSRPGAPYEVRVDNWPPDNTQRITDQLRNIDSLLNKMGDRQPQRNEMNDSMGAVLESLEKLKELVRVLNQKGAPYNGKH